MRVFFGGDLAIFEKPIYCRRGHSDNLMIYSVHRADTATVNPLRHGLAGHTDEAGRLSDGVKLLDRTGERATLSIHTRKIPK